MRQHFIRSCTLLLVTALVGGCAALKGYPDRSGDPKIDLAQLEIFHAPDVITRYTSTSDADRSGLTRRQYRDEVVNARIAAIDLHFNAFQQAMFRGTVGKNIAADFAIIGMGAAATLIGGGVAQALGAAITGVSGANASIDKNLYFEKSMAALLAKMIAMRKQVLVGLRGGLTQSDSDYPLTRALVDLEDYYNAGTIPGAIIGVAETAGAEKKDADDDLKIIEIRRAAGFSTLAIRDRVERLISAIDSAPPGTVLPLAQRPPVADTKIVTKTLRGLFRNQEWTTRAPAAKQALRIRVIYGDRSEASLAAWERALGIPN